MSPKGPSAVGLKLSCSPSSLTCRWINQRLESQ